MFVDALYWHGSVVISRDKSLKPLSLSLAGISIWRKKAIIPINRHQKTNHHWLSTHSKLVYMNWKAPLNHPTVSFAWKTTRHHWHPLFAGMCIVSNVGSIRWEQRNYALNVRKSPRLLICDEFTFNYYTRSLIKPLYDKIWYCYLHHFQFVSTQEMSVMLHRETWIYSHSGVLHYKSKSI